MYGCVRDQGSGSEASFEYLFVGERCSTTSLKVAQENTKQIWANGSAGGVRSCLQHMFAGGTQTGYYTTSRSHVFPASNQYAFGFLNDEIKLKDLTGAGDSFRAVAIDGIGPTIANVQNGYYPYFSTGAAYTITSAAAGFTQYVLAGNQALFATALLGKLGHPAFTSDSNKNYTGILPWSPTLSVGDASPGGIYDATNPATIPATSATAAATPTNPYIKTASGGLNNCDVPVWDSGNLEGTSTTTVEKALLGSGQVND